jgi:hypothetical protein
MWAVLAAVLIGFVAPITVVQHTVTNEIILENSLNHYS